MDTKLKKSHKLTWMIILLAVMIPALVITALYPKMEWAMLDQKEYYDQMFETDTAVTEPTETAYTEEDVWAIESSFVNYAVETSYYIYGKILQQVIEEEVRYDVLSEYGWINDYYEMIENSRYYLEYEDLTAEGDGEQRYHTYRSQDGEVLAGLLLPANESQQVEAFDLFAESGDLAYLTMSWDEYGNLVDIEMTVLDTGATFEGNPYELAQASMKQYRSNATVYNEIWPEKVDAEQLEPKNLKAVFTVSPDSKFAFEYPEYFGHEYYYYSPDAPQLYLETGAIAVVIAAAVFVALIALILPFFKKLETGWEKIFCLPFEIMLCVLDLGILLAAAMYYFMSYTTMYEIEQYIASEGAVVILGYGITAGEIYGCLLVVNFLGWALGFFLEYICVASLRQFLCGPIYYLKHRLLIVMLFRWCWKKCRQLYHYVTDLDITDGMNRSIVKIVLVNFAIVALLCCMWFAGLLGVVIYSVILYILLRKYGETLQKQYQSILHATGEMADGNLKITLDEELGIFEPLGEELSKVQQGFAKAVAEEAKSQNMKTELITNVSHDLKTPLTALITYVDLLKKEDITEEERASYLATVDQKAQRLKVLIEDLFEVSKANSGNVQMNFMDVDVVNLMKQVRLEMEEQLTNSDLTFRWNLPEEKVILSLDGDRMYRVFENLLGNALKYAMPYSRVYVDIQQKDTSVEIIFRNMSASELEFDPQRLTERFVRGDQSRNSEGSGLGLAIAKSFVELQNGTFRIDVDGDLFKVTLTFERESQTTE